MTITSAQIRQAADQLHGFVGCNARTGQYLLRFSADSFGRDVPPRPANTSATPRKAA